MVNYPSPDVPFTRIVEYKHVPNQSEAVKVTLPLPLTLLTLTLLTLTLTLTLIPTSRRPSRSLVSIASHRPWSSVSS